MAIETDDPRRAATLPAPERKVDAERKEKVLHTRVPEALERELRQRARRNGISVSGVVRNVLVRTFGLVEDIVSDSAGIALAIAGHDVPERGAARSSEPDADMVLAWQVAILNLNAVCESCNAILPRGTQAGLGLRRDGARAGAIRCGACLDALAEGAASGPASNAVAGPARRAPADPARPTGSGKPHGARPKRPRARG